MDTQRKNKLSVELGRLLAKCNALLIADYMTKIVVSNVIITLHILGNIIITFDLTNLLHWFK